MKYHNLSKIKHFILIVLLFLFISQIKTIENDKIQQKNILEQIQYLYYKLNHQQYWSKNQKFQSFQQWEHMKGIYQSKVHFNYLDKRNTLFTDKIRNNIIKVDDINMFVSSFVLYGLLQASNLGTIKLDQHKFSQTIQAITQFRDKNTPLGIPQYSFWPQKLINGTWSAHSVNLINLINMIPNLPPFINKYLDKHGLNIVKFMKSISKAFAIPPDNDDSGVNLALLGLLKQSNSTHYQYFNSFNFNKLGFYQKVLKYAYRPFDQDYSQNKRAHQIDPRTYYVLHPFLTQIKQDAEYYNQTASLILPTTWLINLDQQVDDRIIMPFETNNVDATVSANFLFGLTYQVLTQQIKVQDLHEDLVQMMHDTVKLIQYVIQQLDNVNQQGKQQGRLDLILVYYPSKYDFYWFVSRIINLLKKYEQTKLEQEQFKDFKQIYLKLSQIMKNKGTKNILKSKIGIKNSKGLDGSYWQQFLGNYGKKNRNDDALFATSLAMNALLDTWTNRNGKTLNFDSDTPKQVKQSLDEAVRYLRWFINKQMNSKTNYKMKLQNAFFSGSMKIFKTSFPYFYPANVHYDKNGKDFDPNTMQMKDLQFGSKYFMRGYIEDDQYQKMINKKWFGNNVPTNFTGYNDGKGLTFPYWSSKAISQVMIINALSKYLKVKENNYQNYGNIYADE